MTETALKQETYLPTRDDEAAGVYDFLRTHEEAGRGCPEPRYFLSGSQASDRVELPGELYRVLRQAAEALKNNLAVTVGSQTTTVTTQEAADLLGVSRPTLIKLLDEGKVPFDRVGSHRKILLGDLLQYRERRRAEQYAALDATAINPEDDETVEATLRRMREARRAVAARRRGSSS